jgi:ribosome-binding factor A
VAHKRILRVGEAIKRELSFILDRKMGDPRIGMVTVTRVELSDDMRYAKVFVSFLGDDEERRERMRLLRKARRFLRGELAHTLHLRVAPEITFVLDDSAENYIRINEVLKQIHEEEREGEGEQDGPGEGPSGP